MTAWTREHDALIARLAEGWEVYSWDDIWIGLDCHEVAGMAGYELHRKRHPDEIFLDRQARFTVPHYLTDLTAIVRAAEAWRKSAKHNQWIIESPVTGDENDSQFVAIVWGVFGESGRVLADTPAAALARALYRALGGNP